jgi:hypothetical protein
MGKRYDLVIRPGADRPTFNRTPSQMDGFPGIALRQDDDRVFRPELVAQGVCQGDGCASRPFQAGADRSYADHGLEK